MVSKPFRFLVLFYLLMGGVSQAHSYFEGLTDILINQNKNRLEVVHRYITHDLEVLLSERFDRQISADQDEFEVYLEKYINQNFYLELNKEKISLTWLGVEKGISETLIYQMNESITQLIGIEVHNEILTDFFPQQINRTNFKDGSISGTLIFNQQVKQARIRFDSKD